jgi:putative two-component system response regulator
MNRAILPELLVSYRREMSYARLRALLTEVDSAIEELLATKNGEDSCDLLNEIATTIGCLNWRHSLKCKDQQREYSLESLAPVAHRLLLRAATEHIPRATPEKGIGHAERSLDIALAFSLKEETRRGYNVCSALYALTGAAADAVEYGLMAAAYAKQLSYDAAVVNSLANVSGALVLMGLHEDALEIADRVFGAFANNGDCTTDLALVDTNAARAAFVLKRYGVAASYARRAIAGIELTNAYDASNRLLCEFTLMQCAIAEADMLEAKHRMNEVEHVAAAFPSERNELNRQFAEALHTGYVENARLAMVSMLGALANEAKDFTPIYTEVLQYLSNLCSEAGDQRSALLYAGKLVTAIGQTRLNKVRERLAELGQTPKTTTTVTTSAQELIDKILSQAFEEKQTHARVETLGNRELSQSLEQLAATAELCDDPSRRAIYRVGKLSGLLARELGYSEAEAHALEHAARLHDIGKLGIPSAILAKPGERLNESEYQVVWRHARMGAQILAQCHEPIFELAAEIAHSHHEAWDGTGYPRNLRGEEIHEAARIVCLVENYDSMTHPRSYRHAMTHPEAVEFIRNNAATQFDPAMTTVFIQLLERLRAIHGSRLNDRLADAAPAPSERIAHGSLFSDLGDLVPRSVFAKLRGDLFTD